MKLEADVEEKIRAEGAARYGRYYWRVNTTLSGKSQDIYTYADRVEVRDGCLVFYGGWRKFHGDAAEQKPHVMLVLAPGSWKAVYAASVLDGTPVAAEMVEFCLPAQGINLEEQMAAYERRWVEAALVQAGWAKTEASRLLGLSERQLRYLCCKYNLRRGAKKST